MTKILAVDSEREVTGKKAKRVGLFQLWNEIFIARRQIKEIEEAKRELGKNLISLRGMTNPIAGLKYLEEAEKNFDRARALIYQMKERQARFRNIGMRKEDIIIESQFEDMAAYISGVKLIVKIAVDGYVRGDALGEWTQLLTWFGFDSPKVEMSVTLETIDQKIWKLITIKDAKYRPLDAMSPNIIKRQKGIRELFERMGYKFYYQAEPSFGTTITVMMPSKDAEKLKGE